MPTNDGRNPDFRVPGLSKSVRVLALFWVQKWGPRDPDLTDEIRENGRFLGSKNGPFLDTKNGHFSGFWAIFETTFLGVPDGFGHFGIFDLLSLWVLDRGWAGPGKRPQKWTPLLGPFLTLF